MSSQAHFWSLELQVLVSPAAGSTGATGSATCRAAHDDSIGQRTPTHTLLVPRTSTARELCCGLCWRCWLYLPLGNCPGETALVPAPTMVARTGHKSYELTAGSACSFGSSTCRWANIQASLPLDHPAQWSRGPGNLELLACGWRCWLLVCCLLCWLLACSLLAAACWLCCWAHVRLGTRPTTTYSPPCVTSLR